LSPGRRLAINALANWSGTAVATFSSLLLAPFLLAHLGPERFGLYQIARQLVAYFLLLNLGIAGSVVRFTSQAVAARDDARVNAVINSAMALYLGIALAGLVAGLATGYLAPAFFRVDPGYVAETHGLIWALGVWWALGILASPARAVLIGQQRYGWLNLVMAAGWSPAGPNEDSSSNIARQIKNPLERSQRMVQSEADAEDYLKWHLSRTFLQASMFLQDYELPI
jgi:O-antigen/teichoic acid export membrane protein